MRESQSTLILRYMQSGNKITSIEALRKFGSFRLGARVHDLKSMGYVINSEMVERNGKRVAEYSMQVKEEQLELW